MIDTPTASDVPPLPHLIGEKVPQDIKQRENWSARILNAAAILFGFVMLLRGIEVFGFSSRRFNLMVFALMFGTCMITSGLYGFVKLAKQRRENAG